MNYCNDKLYVKDTGDPSRVTGCFTKAKIKKGDLVRVNDKKIYSKDELVGFPQRFQDFCYEIDEDHEVCPVDFNNPSPIWFINHSCEPNMASLPDFYTGMALRDIEAGEELTYDYATLDSGEWEFKCSCGASECRKIIRGWDWMMPELQTKYKGYFQKNIQEKINKLLLVK